MGKKLSREEIDAEMKRRGMKEYTPLEKREMERKKEQDIILKPDQTKTTSTPAPEAQQAIYTNYEDKPQKQKPDFTGSSVFENNRSEYLKAEERRKKKGQ